MTDYMTVCMKRTSGHDFDFSIRVSPTENIPRVITWEQKEWSLTDEDVNGKPLYIERSGDFPVSREKFYGKVTDPIKSKSDAYLARQREIDEVNARRAVVKAQQRDDEKKRAEAAEATHKAEYEKIYALAASQRLSPAQVEEVRAKIDQPLMSFVTFSCPQCRRSMSAVHGQQVMCTCGCVATVEATNKIGTGKVVDASANLTKPIDTIIQAKNNLLRNELIEKLAENADRKVYGEPGVSWTDNGEAGGGQVQVNHPEGRPLVRYSRSVSQSVYMQDGASGTSMTSKNWTECVKQSLAKREIEAKRVRAASVGWDPYADGEV